MAVEPLHGDAQAQLIYLHGLAGRRHLAVAYFHRFRDVLRSELEAEPLPTTVEIFRSVVAGRICPADRIATDTAADASASSATGSPPRSAYAAGHVIESPMRRRIGLGR